MRARRDNRIICPAMSENQPGRVLWTEFGNGQEAAGPQRPDAGGGIMAAIILWSVVSLIFFIANAVAIASLARGRSAAKPLIACALPILCIVVPLVLEPFFAG